MFIYVMDKRSKNALIKRGYSLLKEDSRNHVWVFANKADAQFDDLDIPCVISDTLTF